MSLVALYKVALKPFFFYKLHCVHSIYEISQTHVI